MSYYNDTVTTDEYTDRRGDRYEETDTTTYESSNYGPPRGYGPPPPPQCPPPWVARWDERDQRYFFINEQTGERSWEFPQSYGGGYPQGGYTEQRTTEYVEEERPDHHRRNELLAGGAGVLGGAALLYEGEKVRDDWRRDEYDVDQRFDSGAQDVEDIPDDAARWAGRKVQDVEDIPQDVEYDYDRVKYGVEDIPEDVAGWAGDKVGGVERFDDNIDNAYDQGRYEGETGDRW